MGYIILEKLFRHIICGVSVLLVLPTVTFGQKQNSDSPNLADAFGAPDKSPNIQSDEKEIEPVVLGRKKWSEQPAGINSSMPSNQKSKNNPQNTASIRELEALETNQGKIDPANLPMPPPSTPPAINLHRNFEGTLVLKTRKLGFETAFPFQLENSRGKRLAFIDFQNIRSVDPITLKNKKVNILGKLEKLKEGSDNLVIRARILREIE